MPLNNVCDQLGPDAGQLTNSKKWKRATPSSFSSPYITQADIGKLRSRKAQNEIYDKLGITVRADAFFKRAIAERSIREIKLRMAIHLDFEGRRENTL